MQTSNSVKPIRAHPVYNAMTCTTARPPRIPLGKRWELEAFVVSLKPLALVGRTSAVATPTRAKALKIVCFMAIPLSQPDEEHTPSP